MRLYEADGSARLRVGGLGLQLSEGGADGIELGTGALVDIVLISEDVVHFCSDILNLLAQAR